tara:strand:+ start:1810 stop:2022 length:213 start_codon:yes stop_codon:yes gene_type:complete
MSYRFAAAITADYNNGVAILATVGDIIVLSDDASFVALGCDEQEPTAPAGFVACWAILCDDGRVLVGDEC